MNRFLPAILFHSMSLWSILLHPTPLFYSTLFHSIYFHHTLLYPTPLYSIPLIPCRSISLITWLHSTPFYSTAWLRPCSVWIGAVLQLRWRFIFTNHSCDNCRDMKHLPCVLIYWAALCMHHPLPFNPHKALRCAYFSILLMQMRKLAYTVTKLYAPIHKTNRSQVCDVNPGIRTPAFPLIEKQKGFLHCLQALPREPFQRESIPPRQICREGTEARVPIYPRSENI